MADVLNLVRFTKNNFPTTSAIQNVFIWRKSDIG